MTSGNFAADDSRKLFEALCKSLKSSVFDMPVPQLMVGSRPYSRGLKLARSTSHPPSLRNLALRDQSTSTATLVPPKVARTNSEY